MKDQAIQIHIEQLAAAIRDEINRENDLDRNCRLQDCQEYLARAYATIAQIQRDDFDTTTETARAIAGLQAMQS